MAYEDGVRRIPDYYPEMTIGFDAFRNALRVVDLDRVNTEEYDGDFDPGEFARTVLRDPAFQDAMPEDPPAPYVQKTVPRNRLLQQPPSRNAGGCGC